MTSTTCAAHEYEVGFQLIEEAESRFQVRSVMKRQETGLGKPVVLSQGGVLASGTPPPAFMAALHTTAKFPTERAHRQPPTGTQQFKS